jgi:hypothetical protein
MSSRRTSSVPKEDFIFPRMLYCDSRCSQTLPGSSPALPGALQCNATRCLGDRKRVILRHSVRGSVKAVRAVRNTWVFQTETGVVADDLQTCSIAASKCIVKKRRWVCGDTGVIEVEWPTRSIYSGDPGVDRQHLIFISSCHSTKIHSLSCQTWGLTRTFRDLVDPRNCADPHREVVSYLFTCLHSSSLM